MFVLLTPDNEILAASHFITIFLDLPILSLPAHVRIERGGQVLAQLEELGWVLLSQELLN